VQLFRQQLDVPVQVEHPWLVGAGAPLAGASAVAPLGPARAVGASPDVGGTNGADPDGSTPADADSARIALGADLARAARHAERGADGRRFTVLELQRTFVADAAGIQTVPEARLGFAYALEFRDDLVGGRVPLDRHDAFVRGAPQELVVRPLPEAGLPFSFTGAVGRFSLTAAVSPERVASGGATTLSVTLTAEEPYAAGLERIPGPRLDRFSGFDVVATRDTLVGLARTFVVELTPTSTGRLTLPPIEFATFDPREERYVEHTTKKLHVVVDAPQDVESSHSDGNQPTDADATRGETPWLVIVGIVAALTLFAAAWARSRKSSPKVGDEES
jgi:hypothetical protein